MFHTARIKLTAWYLLIIMAVSVSFSAVIYRAISAELDRFSRMQQLRIERRLRSDIPLPFSDDGTPLTFDDPELVENARHRVILVLLTINGSILVLSGLLGYMLAGQTLQPIQNMMDEQNRFISDASHEFRTPLTAMKSTLEVHLRDKSLTLANAKKVLKENIEDVNTLQSLSDSLLTLAQYQKQNGQEKPETVHIDTIIDDAIKRVTPMANEKEIAIAYDAASIKIIGIRHSLTDLLTILLDNAIKYSSKRTEISVITKKQDHHATISVTDHGIGIAEKDIPHIFNRFYRADTARSGSSKNGYGLGLAIAKKIIDHHHGTIDVKSVVGKGTTFTVILPTNRKHSA